MKEAQTLKEILKKEFGVDLPITGGMGGSINDAIKIDKDYQDWSEVVYTCLRLINRLFARNWRLVRQTTTEKDGKTYDQMTLEIEGDSNNYYNYYFDVSDHLNTAPSTSSVRTEGDLQKAKR